MSSDNDDQAQQPQDWASMTRQEREGAISHAINESLDLRTDQGVSASLDESDDSDDGASDEVSLDDISGPGPGNDSAGDSASQDGEGEPPSLDEQIAQAETDGDWDTVIDLKLQDALGTLGGDAA